MKLFCFPTPNSRGPCAVAKYLDSPVEFVHVDLSKGENKTPEFLAVNPNGKVPALNDGDVNVFEGQAIMMYLAQKANSELWPSAPAKQCEVVQWLSWDRAHFSRHGAALLFERYIKAAFGMGDPDQSVIEESSGFWNRFAAVLDGHLSGRSNLVGDDLTIADFSVASLLPSANEAELPLADFKEVSRWHDALMQIPAWRDPWPDAG